MSSVWRTFETLTSYYKDSEYESKFLVLALGHRKDGVTVMASNGAALFPASQRLIIKMAHAEQRIARKLDRGAEVYVARQWKNGDYSMARPCSTCERILRSRRVSRVFYTIGPQEYGVLEF